MVPKTVPKPGKRAPSGRESPSKLPDGSSPAPTRTPNERPVSDRGLQEIFRADVGQRGSGSVKTNDYLGAAEILLGLIPKEFSLRAEAAGEIS